MIVYSIKLVFESKYSDTNLNTTNYFVNELKFPWRIIYLIHLIWCVNLFIGFSNKKFIILRWTWLYRILYFELCFSSNIWRNEDKNKFDIHIGSLEPFLESDSSRFLILTLIMIREISISLFFHVHMQQIIQMYFLSKQY